MAGPGPAPWAWERRPRRHAGGCRDRPQGRSPASVSGKHLRFDDLADRVPDGDVSLLDARCRIRRHSQQVVAASRHLTAVTARHSNRDDSSLARKFESVEHIWRAPRSGETKKHIAGAAYRFDLTREEALVTVVVADCRQHRRVGGQSEGG